MLKSSYYRCNEYALPKTWLQNTVSRIFHSPFDHRLRDGRRSVKRPDRSTIETITIYNFKH